MGKEDIKRLAEEVETKPLVVKPRTRPHKLPEEAKKPEALPELQEELGKRVDDIEALEKLRSEAAANIKALEDSIKEMKGKYKEEQVEAIAAIQAEAAELSRFLNNQIGQKIYQWKNWVVMHTRTLEDVERAPMAPDKLEAYRKLVKEQMPRKFKEVESQFESWVAENTKKTKEMKEELRYWQPAQPKKSDKTAGAWDKIKGFFSDVWSGIKTLWNSVQSLDGDFQAMNDLLGVGTVNTMSSLIKELTPDYKSHKDIIKDYAGWLKVTSGSIEEYLDNIEEDYLKFASLKMGEPLRQQLRYVLTKRCGTGKQASGAEDRARDLVAWTYSKLAQKSPEHFVNFVLGGMTSQEFIEEARGMVSELEQGAAWISTDGGFSEDDMTAWKEKVVAFQKVSGERVDSAEDEMGIEESKKLGAGSVRQAIIDLTNLIQVVEYSYNKKQDLRQSDVAHVLYVLDTVLEELRGASTASKKKAIVEDRVDEMLKEYIRKGWGDKQIVKTITKKYPHYKSPNEVKEMIHEQKQHSHASIVKKSYVKHCPGHKDSKGELAEWCIYSHDNGKLISSHKSKEDAKKHLQQMHIHKGQDEQYPYARFVGTVDGLLANYRSGEYTAEEVIAMIEKEVKPLMPEVYKESYNQLKQAELVSFKDVYQEMLKETGDERKAVEQTLSLWTGGMFDAAEGQQREKMIDDALRKVSEPCPGTVARKTAQEDFKAFPKSMELGQDWQTAITLALEKTHNTHTLEERFLGDVADYFIDNDIISYEEEELDRDFVRNYIIRILKPYIGSEFTGSKKKASVQDELEAHDEEMTAFIQDTIKVNPSVQFALDWWEEDGWSTSVVGGDFYNTVKSNLIKNGVPDDVAQTLVDKLQELDKKYHIASKKKAYEDKGVIQDSDAKPTIDYAGKTLNYRLTYDDQYFKDWQDEAQAMIDRHGAAVIHRGHLHDLYVPFKVGTKKQAMGKRKTVSVGDIVKDISQGTRSSGLIMRCVSDEGMANWEGPEKGHIERFQTVTCVDVDGEEYAIQADDLVDVYTLPSMTKEEHDIVSQLEFGDVGEQYQGSKSATLTTEEQEELDGLRGGIALETDNETRKQMMNRIKELQSKASKKKAVEKSEYKVVKKKNGIELLKSNREGIGYAIFKGDKLLKHDIHNWGEAQKMFNSIVEKQSSKKTAQDPGISDEMIQYEGDVGDVTEEQWQLEAWKVNIPYVIEAIKEVDKTVPQDYIDQLVNDLDKADSIDAAHDILETEGFGYNKVLDVLHNKQIAGSKKKADRVTKSGEWSESVAEFINKKYGIEIGDEDAFDYVADDQTLRFIQNDIRRVIKHAIGPNNIHIEDVKYIECDSGNISHANAYYMVTVSGPADEVDEVVGEDQLLYAEGSKRANIEDIYLSNTFQRTITYNKLKGN